MLPAFDLVCCLPAVFFSALNEKQKLLPFGKMNSCLLWFLVLILINSLCGSIGQAQPQEFRRTLYEVIIPRKLTPRSGHRKSQDVNYWVEIEGAGYVVHLMQKKGFVPKRFPVFSYNKEGVLRLDYPYIRKDCYYHGFVQDEPFSVAALSTCSGGIRGLLQVKNKTYGIEPIKGSATFQHMVYRMKEKDTSHVRCGVEEEEPTNEEAMIQNTEDLVGKNGTAAPWWTQTRYVKIIVVVEHERYIQFGKNETVVVMHVLDVIHNADSIYRALGIQVSLVGLEIWSEKNFITITDNIDDILEDFNLWRKDNLQPRLSHDISHFFIYKSFGKTLGLAHVAGICDPEQASSVESYITADSLKFALIFAHELGHNLGMLHDNKYCKCSQPTCVMQAEYSSSIVFSNCSYSSYHRLINEGNTDCLKIPPDDAKLYPLKYCGNNIVEPGEQCDCGSRVGCERDPCCQSNCRLRFGATCASGQCCEDCQYRPAGAICRERASVCDLSEYCSGKSEWCPLDFYVQDGAPCSSDSFCYHGLCNTHTKQCRRIFGKGATVASQDCFRHINTKGDRFGNCGITSESYKKCKPGDILCGRIQCENLDNLPDMVEHSTIVQTTVGQMQCWGIDHHHGTERVDIGAVTDGTWCGQDRMCINQKCTNVSLLKYDCNVTKCHSHGICNNLKHCHCLDGWAPPDCLSRGFGGSIDSGSPRQHGSDDGRGVGGIDTSGAIAKTFLIVSPLALTLCLVVYNRKRLRRRIRRLRPKLHTAQAQSTKGTIERGSFQDEQSTTEIDSLRSNQSPTKRDLLRSGTIH